MNNEHLATRISHRANKVTHKVVAFNLVDTNAVLDRDRDVHRVHHGLDAI